MASTIGIATKEEGEQAGMRGKVRGRPENLPNSSLKTEGNGHHLLLAAGFCKLSLTVACLSVRVHAGIYEIVVEDK